MVPGRAETGRRGKTRGGFVDLLGDYLERVEQAIQGRDMRCRNEDCPMFGVVLEVDEIEVSEETPPCCAQCRQALAEWDNLPND